MDIILVPGFWLDASSWEEVTPVLEAAGHRPTPLPFRAKSQWTPDARASACRTTLTPW